MSKYSYSARSAKGELVYGELEAASYKEAAENLRARDYIPISLKEQNIIFDLSGIFKISFGGYRIKLRDLNIFFRQISALSAAGVPLLEALVAVEDQVINEKLKKIIGSLEGDIGGGSTFSIALSKYPSVFPGLVVAMIEAGERSGTLDDVLCKIASYYEKEIQFQQKIQSALRYPVMVLIALTVAFVVVITFVIPQFSVVYRSLKADLPLPTKILIGANYAIRRYFWLLLIIFGSIFYSLRAYIKTSSGRRRWDMMVLKMPVFGVLMTKVSLSRFFRMLAAMISSGISVVTGLETTMSSADNVVISQAIIRIRDRVISGSGLSGPMGEEKIFPSTAVQMVAVGEKSGTLDKMLVKSADYFDEETDYMVSNLMTLLEPFIILFLGLIVLLLALGIFLPMWNLMSVYTKGI